MVFSGFTNKIKYSKKIPSLIIFQVLNIYFARIKEEENLLLEGTY